DRGAAGTGLLRQRAARRDGRGLAGTVRRVLRDHGWSGLRLGRRGRSLGGHRARFTGGPVRGGADPAMIRVVLPAHLRTLARVAGGVELRVEGPVTQGSVLDALGAGYTMPRGALRGPGTKRPRTF